jgi:16S rRNA (uracil1498-N3)-methyltransferase
MPRRFFCSTLPDDAATVTLDEAESHHLRTVLRARDGQAVELLDGLGGRARAEVLPDPVRRGPVCVRILEFQRRPMPARRPVVYVAPPRAKLMDVLVRQATELGVWAIRPVVTERSVATPPASAVAGWLDGAREACKQSGNPWLPSIAPPRILAEALSSAPSGGYIAWLDPDSSVPASHRPTAGAGEIPIWIGPEGGFSPAEAEAIRAAGAQPIGLGPHILRTETAVIAALALLA